MKLLRGLACLLSLGACTPADSIPRLAANVDLQAYAGRWYIIANIPYFAERGRVASYFDVAIAGMRFTDTYVGRRDFASRPFRFTMRGYVRPGTGNAWWRESPLWPVYFSYLILDFDSRRGTALVGYPGRNLGWILAREPDLDAASYQAQLEKLRAAGYDPTRFRRVAQHPAQLGQPGFQ